MSARLACFLLLVAVLAPSVVLGTDYYVNGATGSDGYDGLAAAWDGSHGPKLTIQAGIDAATGGDTVTVADGTYTGAGNKDLDFHGRDLVLQSKNGAAATTIDCDGSGRGFDFHSGETMAAVVMGFTVQNGNVVGDEPAGCGPGIRCTNASSPLVMQCVIRDGYSGKYGGGVYVSSSDPAFIGCAICGNNALKGGGVYVGSGTPTFDTCLVEANVARNSGAALWFGQSSDPLVVGSLLRANDAGLHGGGIYSECDGGAVIRTGIVENTAVSGGGGIMVVKFRLAVEECLICGNTAGSNGGGIYTWYESCNASFVKCLISSNSSHLSGGGGYLRDGSNATFICCALVDNYAGDHGGGLWGAPGEASFEDCLIACNDGDKGGGVCIDGGRVSFLRCMVRSNNGRTSGGGIWLGQTCAATIAECMIERNVTVKLHGGGIYSLSPDAWMANCRVVENAAASGGGGVMVVRNDFIMLNCLIADNDAGILGGGVYAWYENARPVMTNCTVANNEAVHGGGGIYCRPGSSALLRNCIDWGNVPSPSVLTGAVATYSDIEGGWPGEGNIDADPHFILPAIGDYRLWMHSPCIDAGTSDGAPSTDYYGRARRDEPIVLNTGGGGEPWYDMGAFEFYRGKKFGQFDPHPGKSPRYRGRFIRPCRPCPNDRPPSDDQPPAAGQHTAPAHDTEPEPPTAPI